MHTWALLKSGKIVNTVTTNSGIRHMQAHYPDYEVADIYTLPTDVQQAYQYWNERP